MVRIFHHVEQRRVVVADRGQLLKLVGVAAFEQIGKALRQRRHVGPERPEKRQTPIKAGVDRASRVVEAGRLRSSAHGDAQGAEDRAPASALSEAFTSHLKRDNAS